CDRAFCKKHLCFLPPDYREPTRLVQIGRYFREELAVGEANRNGDAHFLFDLARKSGQHDGWCRTVEPVGTGEIEEGFIDGDRLNERCKRKDAIVYLIPCGYI